MKKKLRVYLCDPTYDVIIPVSDTIPINIGYIGAYAKKNFGDQIDLRLFKFPQPIFDAIKSEPPDVIACSNYSWNSRLSEFICGFAKKHNPNALTIQGGTNFPHEGDPQFEFAKARPNTDFFTQLEGEVSLSALLGRYIESLEGGRGLYDESVPGCVGIVPETKASENPVFMRGEKPARVRELDEIPSPYLTGLLDPFFDGKLMPFLETNRGCPFLCTFCHTGNLYFNKINMFSIERIKEEIRYIADKVQSLGIKNLLFADTNFGMYKRDREICELLAETQKTHKWPLQIITTTGKNKKEQVIELTKLLNKALTVSMSVQSMTPQVLKNVKRQNIKLDHYLAINQDLNSRGESTFAELIMGMPGETFESFMESIKKVMDAETSKISLHAVLMLFGTPFKDDDYRTQYAMKGKYRIVPLTFGKYEKEVIVDAEEVCIATKDMSFQDYLSLRTITLLLAVVYNSRTFYEFFKYAADFGCSSFEFLKAIFQRIPQAPKEVRSVIDGFLQETKDELWDTEEALLTHYQKPENYQRLLDGDAGGNLMHKYKAMSLAYAHRGWVEFLKETTSDVVAKQAAFASTKNAESLVKLHLDTLETFVKNRLDGTLDESVDLTTKKMITEYDMEAWLNSANGEGLEKFKCNQPRHYQFLFTSDQIDTIKNLFRRYGNSVNALSKIINRVNNERVLMRTAVVS